MSNGCDGGDGGGGGDATTLRAFAIDPRTAKELGQTTWVGVGVGVGVGSVVSVFIYYGRDGVTRRFVRLSCVPQQ